MVLTNDPNLFLAHLKTAVENRKKVNEASAAAGEAIRIDAEDALDEQPSPVEDNGLSRQDSDIGSITTPGIPRTS